jgi:PKD repeat protein
MIDSEGYMLWEKCYGGTSQDNGYSILETDDNNFILTGYTESDDGDVSGNHGNYDIWVVRINSQGDILWQKCYGGTSNDISYAIIQTDNGGYLLTGNTFSHDGDIAGNHGAPDLVGIEIDSEGNILWQKCYGGTSSDYGRDVMTYNGNYIFVGHTNSIDDDVTGYHGYQDAWVIQTDEKGNIKWTRSCGGSSSDSGFGGISRGDGTFVIIGDTYSRDGDVSNPKVNYDLWTFMIDELQTDFSADILSGKAPLTVTFTGWTSSGMEADTWNWYFGDGGISHEENPVHQYTAPGTYTVRMEVAGSGFTESVEKPGYITVR